MGYVMVNVFLAIVMDAYARVVGDARLEGAATVFDDFGRARSVVFKSGLSKNFKAVIKSDRMKSVIQIAQKGDILSGITAANSLTDLEVRVLKKAFVKKQRPEDDPIEDLSEALKNSQVETQVRMERIEAMLAEQSELLKKLTG